MKQTELFGKTVKDTPKDLTAVSHKLLYRGGFIRAVSSGRYAFLPLGQRVYDKIYSVIDQEMASLGAQKVTTPTLHPIELWQATNRDKAFGSEMLIVEDHHGATFAIGATAEVVMVDLVKKFNPTYKDLPINIYQFVQKFRDEKRPRGGLLRVREFMMKDAYSFHATEDDLLNWYKKYYESYIRIAAELDLNAIPVIAHSGAIGGDYNHEFMVLADSGEDTVLMCSDCDYAANEQMAESRLNNLNNHDEKELPKEDVVGEGVIGVEALSQFLKVPLEKTTKTILFNADNNIVAGVIRGDFEINETKLTRILKADTLTLASADEVKSVTGAEIGYAGPLNLKQDIKVFWDISTRDRVNFEVGSNKTNYHTINVNFGSDLKEPEQYFDIRQVHHDESCPKCDHGTLIAKKAIEYGHVFKQDQFYTKPLNATYVDQNNKDQLLWMGAYGIGVGRAMATIVETHNDERGIIWPENISPFKVHLIELPGAKNIDEVYNTLIKQSIDVLWDDREVSAGEKFADSDLIGIAHRLVISAKTGDKIEYKSRSGDKPELLDLSEIINKLK